jgi:glycosyltransferase involved in cell wall biosynthesis
VARAAPLITTVIPTYRRPQLLERAITSVLAQTYERLQVCVYDNASGDETAAVVERLARADPRVQYVCHAENIGMAANFTYALEHVTTPYFSILADDDYHLPGFFTTAMEGFAAHPDAMFSAGSVVSMTEAGQVTHVSMSLWERDGYFAAPEGLFEWTIPRHPDITGLLFRSEVMQHVGLLDPALLNADYDFEWRIISRFPYVVSKRPCVVSVVHETQATRTSDASVWLRSYHTMQGHLDRNGELTDDVRVRAKALLTQTFGDAMLVVGLTALRDGSFSIAEGAADALGKEFGRTREGRILALLTRACQRVRPLHGGLNGAYALVLASRRWRTRDLKREMDGELAAARR